MIIILFFLFFLFYFLRNQFIVVSKFPKLFVFKIYDLYSYIRYKKWLDFSGYGLHIYIGMFGSGKTLSLVRRARYLACKYPSLSIYSNIELIDFPDPSRIYRLENYHQLILAPPNSLFVIDEISSLFNSRKWSEFPFVLLSQLLQVRKNRKMILATAQRFSHVDKLLRDVTTTVIDCSCYFNRLCINKYYDASEYERSELFLPRLKDFVCYVASNKLRNSYDTFQLISDDVKTQFLSNSEVLEARSYSSVAVVTADSKKPKRKFFKKK